MRKAALIFNPVAGRGRGDLAALVELLGAAYDVAVFETCRERDADVCARDALSRGAEVVIAAGGDGTVSAVAGELVGKDATLGVIPRGTANSFARALGIPFDPEAACAVIRNGATRTIDSARCNGRTMVLFASIGVHADTIVETSRDAKTRWGALAYVATAAKKLSSIEPFSVELETAREVIRCRASAITVANLAPPTTVMAQGPPKVQGDDGRLDVTLLAMESLGEAVAATLHLYRSAREGEGATRDDIGWFSAGRLVVRADPPQRVMIDGEDAGETPALLECVPASLRVLVAETAEEHVPPDRKLEGLPELEIERKQSERSEQQYQGLTSSSKSGVVT